MCASILSIATIPPTHTQTQIAIVPIIHPTSTSNNTDHFEQKQAVSVSPAPIWLLLGIGTEIRGVEHHKWTVGLPFKEVPSFVSTVVHATFARLEKCVSFRNNNLDVNVSYTTVLQIVVTRLEQFTMSLDFNWRWSVLPTDDGTWKYVLFVFCRLSNIMREAVLFCWTITHHYPMWTERRVHLCPTNCHWLFDRVSSQIKFRAVHFS